MVYSEQLAQRMRDLIGESSSTQERKMFGGLAFMIHGNMCIGVCDDMLMLRLGEAGATSGLKEPNTKPMDFTGKPMKTMLFVLPDGIKTDKQLQDWMQKGISFALTLPSK